MDGMLFNPHPGSPQIIQLFWGDRIEIANHQVRFQVEAAQEFEPAIGCHQKIIRLQQAAYSFDLHLLAIGKNECAPGLL
jgi:hypothetical protein